MTGNNPTDRSKIGTKRHLLTDKNGIPLSTVITSASTHDIKAVADVIDNSVINRPSNLSFTKKNKRMKYNHLCLDKAYNSKPIENEIIRRGYVPHIPYKRKRGQRKEEIAYQHKHQTIRNKRWVVERTNSWHNRFRKLFTRYEKKVENYLFGATVLQYHYLYRKIILG